MTTNASSFLYQSRPTEYHASYSYSKSSGAEINFETSGGPQFLFLIGILIFVYGFILYRRYRRLQDTPRIPARSVPMGFVHVHGKAEATESLMSPITKTPCLYYSLVIENWVRAGKRKGWNPLKSDKHFCKFYVEDETGRVLVNPAGAKFDSQRSFRGSIGPQANDGFYTDPTLGAKEVTANDLLLLKNQLITERPHISLLGKSGQIGSTKAAAAFPGTGSYRFTEICLPVGREVSVFGTCNEGASASNLSVIGKGQKEKTFVITSNPEGQLEGHLRSWGVKLVLAGAIVLVLSLAMMRPTVKTFPADSGLAHASGK
jgi:hypothetical protein